jgi:hypothetical protein
VMPIPPTASDKARSRMVTRTDESSTTACSRSAGTSSRTRQGRHQTPPTWMR